MLFKESKKLETAYSLVLEYGMHPEERDLDQPTPEEKEEVNIASEKHDLKHAKIVSNLIPVIPSEHMGKKRLTISVPNGWDDLKKLTKKVLEFEGDNYTFIGWNSDRNEAFFVETQNIAKIK